MRLTILAIALSACVHSGDPPIPDGAPDLPAKADDTRFQIAGVKGWYLVRNGLTQGDDRLAFAVTGSASVVDAWIDGRYAGRARRTANRFAFSLDISGLAVGPHRVLLAADGERIAFAALPFQRSHPLYVVVSNDWDDPDHGNDKLARQERLHARHPALVLTHFVGPYTFTDPAVTPARRAELVAWVNKLAATEGDEIGLHVHPWCSFATSAGVACRTQPSFADTSDATGYTVILASYTRTELETLFRHAAALFEQNGLPRPTSFRAGGWTANVDVLGALAAAGHVVDSSGCNWSRLEEWKNQPGAALYAWNQAQWSAIDDTSQPYYPSRTDIQADGDLPILEVPDNGLLVDYVTGNEMIAMLDKNWPERGALREPVTYSIGYHPPNFSEAYFARIDQALTEIDKHLASDGAGPIVYVRMSDLKQVY